MTTPFFHSKIVSSSQLFPIPEGDQHHTQISSFTSPSPPFLFDTQHHHKLHDQAVLHDQEIMKGSTWCKDYGGGGGILHRSSSSSSSSDHPQDEPVKWMSSKMRIMRKMIINSYQTPATKPRRCSNNNHHIHLQDQNNKKAANLDTIIRVCSDCNTTKTPLWRSGPSGPKSLCNACGIRQRKARRAMAATNSAVKDNAPPSEVDRTVPFKKRCRFAAAAAAAACVDSSTSREQRKLCFEEIVIRLSKKSSAFHRVFPQDEKDAAILLMALSSGLLCSS